MWIISWCKSNHTWLRAAFDLRSFRRQIERDSIGEWSPPASQGFKDARFFAPYFKSAART